LLVPSRVDDPGELAIPDLPDVAFLGHDAVLGEAPRDGAGHPVLDPEIRRGDPITRPLEPHRRAWLLGDREASGPVGKGQRQRQSCILIGRARRRAVHSG
jgi:hypothetical protein